MPDQNKLDNNEQETTEQTTTIRRDGVNIFSDHLKKMAESIRQFEAEDQNIKEQIERGGKRTSGRIL